MKKRRRETESVSRVLIARLKLSAALSILGAVFSMLSATPATAQTIPPGTFKHIIIIVQENRTPDNLFGAGPAGLPSGSQPPSLSRADYPGRGGFHAQ